MAKVKRETQFWESARTNNQTFQYFYHKIFELAISRFKYNNLPEGMSERYIELILYAYGCTTLFYDDVLDSYLSLKADANGGFDVYNNPVAWTATASNGYTRRLTNKEAVLMYNNYSRWPTMQYVDMMAYRLYLIQRAIDTNVNSTRTPIVIACEEEQRLTMTNLMKQYDGNIPFIMANKSLTLDDIKVLDLKVTYNADRLQQLKTELWNEILTNFGVANTSYVKKERLISDEVVRSMGGTIANRQSMLAAREEGLNKFNKMFNKNVDVKFRDSVDEYIEASINAVEGGKTENEQVYNGNSMDS